MKQNVKKKSYRRCLTILIIMCMLIAMTRHKILDAEANDVGVLSRDQMIENAYYPEDYSGYRFPVLPGTTNWPYGDYSVMISTCKIPERNLESMTTEELLQTVLVHPLIYNVYAYDSISEGYNAVKQCIDCLQELCLRPDRMDCLYDYVSAHADLLAMPAEKTGDTYIDFLIRKPKAILFLLAESADFFNEEINSSEAALAEINRRLKENRTTDDREIRDLYPLEYHRVVGPANRTYERPVHNVHGYPMDGLQYQAAEEWLYNNGMYYVRYFNEYSDYAKADMTSNIYGVFGISPISGYGPTIEYNCHSYAWNSDYKYTCWVDTFTSDGFTETTFGSVAIGGNVVYYQSSGGTAGSNTPYVHSAVVYSKTYQSGYNILLKSKWGSSGVYVHSISNCPYYMYDETTPRDRKYFNP